MSGTKAKTKSTYENEVCMKRYIKNPYAQSIKEKGYTVTVTRGEGDKKEIVREYFVSPEEVAEHNRLRDEHLKNMRVQT